MKTNESYFTELHEQITDTRKWSKDKFIVFNHEAGTGKSTFTHRIIGEMTKSQKHRVLFVQRFSKENELDNTVEAINRHAGRKVAISFTGEDTRKVKSKESIIDRHVICITHQMYIQVCKGEHPYLTKDRNILIIDEYPDLLEKISISGFEIGQLWAECNKRQVPEINDWAIILRDLKDECKTQIMTYIDFTESKYKSWIPVLKSAIAKIKEENAFKGIVRKCLQLLANGGFLFEDSFHTFNGDQQFLMLENNIVLDANAAFDYRYKLCDKFDVRKQEKIYDYAKDTLHHVQIKTTKKEMNKFEEIVREALKEIHFEGKSGVLFITDKANIEKLRERINQFFSEYGSSFEEIEKTKISIDYFGNIIGVNHYRDYDAVVLLKTPNFDYLTYASTYHYYKRLDNKSVDNIALFRNEEVEAIRRNTVAGEMYQAIKRVNRDNSKCADVYIFSDYQDAVDIVKEQLPNIRYVKMDPYKAKEMDKRDYDNTKRMRMSKKEQAKEVLLEAKRNGVSNMRKKELRDRLELSDDASRISRILSWLEKESFLMDHGICHNGQQFWFLDNLNDDERKFIESA